MPPSESLLAGINGFQRPWGAWPSKERSCRSTQPRLDQNPRCYSIYLFFMEDMHARARKCIHSTSKCSNRVGKELAVKSGGSFTFYGSYFITDHTRAIVPDAGRHKNQCCCKRVTMKTCARLVSSGASSEPVGQICTPHSSRSMVEPEMSCTRRCVLLPAFYLLSLPQRYL